MSVMEEDYTEMRLEKEKGKEQERSARSEI